MAKRSRTTSAIDVRLRDATEKDLPIFFEHQMDPVALEMAAFTPRDEKAFMEHWAKILADAALIKKAILLGGHVVGNVVCFERWGKREVGYWIGREHWGKGIATKALSEFLRHVKTRPLYARVAKQNPASIRVLEKCGFVISEEDDAPHDPRLPEVEEIVLKLSGSLD